MRAVAVLLATLVTSMLLAGCSDGGGKVPTTAGDVLVDATGKARIDEAPSEEVVDTPAGSVAVNKGLLVGRVRDAANFSVAGARVDVLGTENGGVTDFQGRFRFENVTPGSFDVRVEAAGFTPKELRATIVAGKQTDLDVELTVKDGLDPGLAPHVHDYWGQDAERVLMDAVVPMPERLKPGKFATTDLMRGNNNAEWPFVLPDQDDGKPATVWPGTKEIRFNLAWGNEAENTVPNAVVLVKSPLMEKPLELAPVTSSGGSTSYVLASNNETDVGHQEFTRWQFWLNINNSPQTSTTAYKPTLATDGIAVKVTIVKGDLALEVAHRDFWRGNDTLAIGDHSRGCVPNTGVPPVESDRTDGAPSYYVCPIHAIGPADKYPDAVNIIPPGTKKVQVEFTWTSKPQAGLPMSYYLTYRTARMDPVHTPASDYLQPKVLEEGGNRILYEIELQPGDADGFYQQRSGWGFKWHWDGNPGYQSGYVVQFGLKVTAFKDPAYG